ncbi:MAG TPA: Ig domain-containing protein [Nitrospira sp.]
MALLLTSGLTGCGDVSHAPAPAPGPGALAITTTSLPTGTVNQPYATVIGGSGGITPYTWSLAAGSPAMPAGLFLDSATGAITGVPTAIGTTSLIFRLDDESTPNQFVEQTLSLTIVTTPQPLSITTSSLPDGVVNQPYLQTALQASGGIQPYTWSVSPALPNGLSLNVVGPGIISGTPLSGTAGTTTHTFTVSDSVAPVNQTATKQLSLKINSTAAPLTITAPSGTTLKTAKVGQNYSTTLQGTGGILPYTWSITPGLPAGLQLNASTGAITGQPANGTAGIYSLTITLKDSFLPTNQTKTKSVTLTVNP